MLAFHFCQLPAHCCVDHSRPVQVFAVLGEGRQFLLTFLHPTSALWAAIILLGLTVWVTTCPSESRRRSDIAYARERGGPCRHHRL